MGSQGGGSAPPRLGDTANLCLSPGLGLLVALRARRAVTLSSGTGGRRTDVPGGSAVCQGLLLHYPSVLPGGNPC